MHMIFSFIMEQLVHNALYVDIVYALMWNVIATVAIV